VSNAKRLNLCAAARDNRNRCSGLRESASCADQLVFTAMDINSQNIFSIEKEPA
jgi:hypothetical protein